MRLDCLLSRARPDCAGESATHRSAVGGRGEFDAHLRFDGDVVDEDPSADRSREAVHRRVDAQTPRECGRPPTICPLAVTRRCPPAARARAGDRSRRWQRPGGTDTLGTRRTPSGRTSSAAITWHLRRAMRRKSCTLGPGGGRDYRTGRERVRAGGRGHSRPRLPDVARGHPLDVVLCGLDARTPRSGGEASRRSVAGSSLDEPPHEQPARADE